MIDQLPLSVQTTYQSLLDAHLMRAADPMDGSPNLVERGDKAYWYTKVRIGDRTINRYIGPDSNDLRERMEHVRTERQDAKTFDRHCGLLAAQLRAAGLLTPDRTTARILDAMAKVGVFRLGGTLVGTHAFRLYDAALGLRVTRQALAVTEDIDIAAFERLTLVLDDNVSPSLAEGFAELRLAPVPSIHKRQHSAHWRMPGSATVVDFLTPSFETDEGLRELKSLGVWAHSLHFLNFLIAEPIPAVSIHRSGTLVQIPRPERYAVHKLIVSQRRRGPNRLKARKDLGQAAALIAVLAEDRPSELLDAYETAQDKGPKWREALDAALDSLPLARAVLSGL